MNWRCWNSLIRDLVAEHGVLVTLACAVCLPFGILWVWVTGECRVVNRE